MWYYYMHSFSNAMLVYFSFLMLVILLVSQSHRSQWCLIYVLILLLSVPDLLLLKALNKEVLQILQF